VTRVATPDAKRPTLTAAEREEARKSEKYTREMNAR
jgi:hypothetical protein